MLFLWGCLTVVGALYGRELLAYSARFDESGSHITIAKDFRHGHAPLMHYEDFGSSLMSALNVFYNEEWHISMFEFARVTNLSIVFYVPLIILG
jgi:hypothetical protein